MSDPDPGMVVVGGLRDGTGVPLPGSGSRGVTADICFTFDMRVHEIYTYFVVKFISLVMAFKVFF